MIYWFLRIMKWLTIAVIAVWVAVIVGFFKP